MQVESRDLVASLFHSNGLSLALDAAMLGKAYVIPNVDKVPVNWNVEIRDSIVKDILDKRVRVKGRAKGKSNNKGLDRYVSIGLLGLILNLDKELIEPKYAIIAYLNDNGISYSYLLRAMRYATFIGYAKALRSNPAIGRYYKSKRLNK